MLKIKVLLLLPMLAFFWGCGYKLTGTGSVLPAKARTIAIPDFKNATTRFQAEHFISFSLREKFLKRSRLQLVDSPANADLFLSGEITRFEVRPVSYSAQGAANLYQIRIRINIMLTETSSGTLLYESRNQSFSETYETDGGDFFSQESEKLQKIAERLAASIVAAILEGF